MDTDVLIVGAGPTGLMLANQLARRGVRTSIIDRHAHPARETRALGVQARTLEIYQKLGVVEQAIALGKRGDGANLWADGRRMARVPLADAGEQLSPYPYILVLGQDDNEKILGERLHDFGQSVTWNTELMAFTQTAEGVIATLRRPDGSLREVRAAYIAGCDGARSAVREQSGIGFPGAPYEQVFFVADVEASGGMVPDEVNVYLWKEGFHLMFPMRGTNHWRLVGILPEALRDRPDVRFEDVVPAVHAQAGEGLQFAACTWFSTYRIHHRSASRFREGRAFVLGDAAHIHSPLGAQGMNTGLQDAYNLGWKLALVTQGRADASLLDSYEAERMPVARRLLDTTDRGFRLVVSDSWFAGLLRTEVLARVGALAMRQPRIQRRAFRTVSQIGIEYRESALSMTQDSPPEAAPRAGDRFPWLQLRFTAQGPVQDLFAELDDLHFHLLVFGQPAPQRSEWARHDLLRMHVLPSDPVNEAQLARARIPGTSFYLLRPDGYIGLSGARVDPGIVDDYLRERLAWHYDSAQSA
ncbi:FAD-dependent monooxygenase [Variovorax sp. KK3]|uniref:FAD-dependent monooxygenase n=1 Tax=Variovorax sp. KK3 TaxID=1855728 RepID=UPI00097BB262|nr:FAD-dependent monooxygenase [Variovorax sp. KK3]